MSPGTYTDVPGTLSWAKPFVLVISISTAESTDPLCSVLYQHVFIYPHLKSFLTPTLSQATCTGVSEAKVKVKVANLCLFFGIPWTAACQAPLSMEFSRQEYWSGLLFPSPRDLPNPGIKPRSPTLQVDSLPS